MQYFEDIVVNERVALGGFDFSAQAIVAFARKYDPQPFHLDEEAGRQSLFGGLAASGWQTASVWMKLWTAHVKSQIAAGTMPADGGGPSPGFDDLRWLKPVLAGDHLEYTSTVTEKRLLASRLGWGLVSGLGEGFNQRGEAVFSYRFHVFARARPGLV